MRSLAPLLALLICGCHSPAPAPTASSQFSGRSLADMEAEYAKLRAQYLQDCVNGTPEQITANQPLCAQERERTIPLGTELTRLEQDAAQRTTNR